MRVLIHKIWCFLKHLIFSLRAVVSLHIGTENDEDASDQDTEEKED